MPETPATQPAPEPAAYVIIRGQTTGGSKFRPSDWCDRLYNALRVLGDEADYYAEFVQLANVENQKCIVVNLELEEINYRLYTFFMRFAQDNKLATENISQAQWQALHNH